ncbi:prepilin peptidase [Candidatus Woesearchaeota archaeon]|nr:prepilin peptidase [Candidatus Woesearchaeota archaeon]
MIFINGIFLGAILFFASIFDIKTREVPDWLSYSLIYFSVAASLIYSIIQANYVYILNSVLGLAAGFVLAILLFYLGQWGGGDSKLLMGLGSSIGIGFSLANIDFFVILINIFIVGFLYGFIYSVMLALKHRKKFSEGFKNKIRTKPTLFLRRTVIIIVFLGIMASFFLPLYLKIFTIGFTGILFFIFYLWIFTQVIEETCMIKKTDINKLTIGDWLVEPVKIRNKIIIGKSKTGLTKKQVDELRLLSKKGKIKKVIIKEGIPFIPSFFIGYLVFIAYGNWMLFVF